MPVARNAKGKRPIAAKRKPPVKADPEVNAQMREAMEAIAYNKRVMKGNIHSNSRYHPGFCHIVANMMAIGAINANIARTLGVRGYTLVGWQNQYPEFRKAMQESRNNADAEVENALRKRALGYERVEEFVNARGRRVRVTKHYPAEINAAQFWLRNRQPKHWRDQASVTVATATEIAAALRAQAEATQRTTEDEERNDGVE